MGNIRMKIWLIKRLSIRTLYFNFKYLPFRQAVHLPVFISKKVYLRTMAGKITVEGPIYPGLIRIGFGDIGIFDDKVSRTIWEVSGSVVFRGSAEIGHGSKISVGAAGTLIMGSNFKITAESSIVAFSSVEFGSDCLLSWEVLVMDTDFHSIRNSEKQILNAPQAIKVGDKVWIGCRSLILKGVSIPDNCVVGANSLVNKSLENANCVYAGNPVKFVKEFHSWEI